LTKLLKWGEELEQARKNPTEEEYNAGNPSLGEKLCNNLVLLGLNAGAMPMMTPAWHFFHKRYNRTKDRLIDTHPSECNLREYINKCCLPFEGAYITDIVKFQGEDYDLCLQPDSGRVSIDNRVLRFNFKFLKDELDLLHKNDPGSGMLLVPLGVKCEGYLKEFIKWLSERLTEEDMEWIVVTEKYMPHYAAPAPVWYRAPKGVEDMRKWCDEHIDSSRKPF